MLKVVIGAVMTADIFMAMGIAWASYGQYAILLMRPGRCPLAAKAHSAEEAKWLNTRIEHFTRTSRLIRHDDGLDLWQTPEGNLWVPQGDKILPVLLAEQDLKIYGEGEHSVRPGDIVLDCGANIGEFTNTALAAGARQVIAIEPAPRTLECLRRNLAPQIAAGRVVVYAKGVWDKDDWLPLAVDELNAGHNSLVMELDRPKSARVPLTTIDKLVAELKLKRVDFIKMDIEGAEKNALRGAHATIAAFHPRMAISPEHLPDDMEKIPEVVHSLWAGYRMECLHCLNLGGMVRPQALSFF